MTDVYRSDSKCRLSATVPCLALRSVGAARPNWKLSDGMGSLVTGGSLEVERVDRERIALPRARHRLRRRARAGVRGRVRVRVQVTIRVGVGS